MRMETQKKKPTVARKRAPRKAVPKTKFYKAKKRRSTAKEKKLHTIIQVCVLVATVGALSLVMFGGSRFLKRGIDATHVRDFVLPSDYSEEAAQAPVPKPVQHPGQPTPTGPILKTITLPIIMYHYVEYLPRNQNDLKARLNTAPNLFESQIKSLADEGYTTYFAKDIPLIMAGRKIQAPKSVVLTFDDGYEDFYTYAFPILKKYGMKGTNYVITEFVGRYGFLNTHEIQELAASGLVEIGAHTLDHLDMSTVSTSEAVMQILGSKLQLEALIGEPVETFAYPSGKFNDSSIDVVKQASYSAAVSVIDGQVHTPESLYILNRIRAQALPATQLGEALAHWGTKTPTPSPAHPL
jgi:peptidoglycan/xylan/chitin deacetylase (PgdA/CDA1 family)